MAQQSRRQRAAPAHATAAAAPGAAVVAGWHADRFHGTDTQDGPGKSTSFGGGGRSAADPGRGPSRVGSRLGSRREVSMFGRPPDYLAEPAVPKAIHLLDLRTKELSTLPGSERPVRFPVVAQWTLCGRGHPGPSQTAPLRFQHQAWTELGRFKTVHNPVWSRDERFLYFEVVDEASIYRARLSDRAVERVVGHEGGVEAQCTGAASSRVWRRTTLLSFRVTAPTPTSTLWIGRCGDS